MTSYDFAGFVNAAVRTTLTRAAVDVRGWVEWTGETSGRLTRPDRAPLAVAWTLRELDNGNPYPAVDMTVDGARLEHPDVGRVIQAWARG